MNIKKTAIALIVLVPVVAGLVLFWPSTGVPTDSIPASPECITEPGRYSMGDGRYIKIALGDSGLEYWEGHEDSVDPDSSLPQIVSYSASKIPSVELSDGWSLEFTPPDQFEISSGTGEVIRRTFGEDASAPEPKIPTGSVIRTRNEDTNAEQDAAVNRQE